MLMTDLADRHAPAESSGGFPVSFLTDARVPLPSPFADGSNPDVRPGSVASSSSTSTSVSCMVAVYVPDVSPSLLHDSTHDDRFTPPHDLPHGQSSSNSPKPYARLDHAWEHLRTGYHRLPHEIHMQVYCRPQIHQHPGLQCCIWCQGMACQPSQVSASAWGAFFVDPGKSER